MEQEKKEIILCLLVSNSGSRSEHKIFVKDQNFEDLRLLMCPGKILWMQADETNKVFAKRSFETLERSFFCPDSGIDQHLEKHRWGTNVDQNIVKNVICLQYAHFLHR
jgi:hypothetical protein